MKNFKNILLALAVLTASPIVSMQREAPLDSKPFPFNKKTEKEIDETLASWSLPADVRMEIKKILVSSRSAQEAMKAMRNLSMVNRNFNNFFKDKSNYDRVNSLVNRLFN